MTERDSVDKKLKRRAFGKKAPTLRQTADRSSHLPVQKKKDASTHAKVTDEQDSTERPPTPGGLRKNGLRYNRRTSAAIPSSGEGGKIRRQRSKENIDDELFDDKKPDNKDRSRYEKIGGSKEPTGAKDGPPYIRPYPQHMFVSKDNIPPDSKKNAYTNFVKDILKMGIEGLFDEYNKELRGWVPPKEHFETKVFRENSERNRYRDIICNDTTRVVLKDGRGQNYIHANYIRGEPLYNDYICTQGPLENTVIDFWRMVVLEGVEHIVMLCECVELGKIKCHQYWPAKEGDSMTIGNFIISNLGMDRTDAHVFRTILDVEIEDKRYIVQHHHWKTWPDKSTPKSVMAGFRILRAVRRSLRPVVVHCSAGIGRTGTFVGIEMCLQQILLEKPLNILEMCKKLRAQRMHSVQVDLQYIYIAVALVEYAKSRLYVTDTALVEGMNRFMDLYDRQVRSRVGPDGSVPKDAFSRGAAASSTPPTTSPCSTPTTSNTPTSTPPTTSATAPNAPSNKNAPSTKNVPSVKVAHPPPPAAVSCAPPVVLAPSAPAASAAPSTPSAPSNPSTPTAPPALSNPSTPTARTPTKDTTSAPDDSQTTLLPEGSDVGTSTKEKTAAH